jgi:hypothetical protein
VKADPRFSSARIDHRQDDEEGPEGKQSHFLSGCLVKFFTVTAS